LTLEVAATRVVDARGHRCPVPTLRLRRALERAGAGETVELLADDPMARLDVPHFVAGAGHALTAMTSEGCVLRFQVRKRPNDAAPAPSPA
jgi:tRNA 2-thiouridine synthesizing protein A